VLAKICESALTEAQDGKAKLVNYRQLPEFIWPALMEFWRVKFSAEQTARMLAAAPLNAKNPGMPFEPDSAAKRNSATPELRAITQQWLDPVYQQLEAQRQAGGFA
jgi:hypothetical protein